MMDISFCIGEYTQESLLQFYQDRGLAAFTVVKDENTYPILGRQVQTALHGRSWDVKAVVFSEPELVPEVRVRWDCMLGECKERLPGVHTLLNKRSEWTKPAGEQFLRLLLS
jgi:hypothetical protein